MLGGSHHPENPYFLTDVKYLCSDGYPGELVTDEQSCYNAGVLLDYPYGGRRDANNVPSGCIKYTWNNVLYLNKHTGVRHWKTQQVCKKTGTEKILYLF